MDSELRPVLCIEFQRCLNVSFGVTLDQKSYSIGTHLEGTSHLLIKFQEIILKYVAWGELTEGVKYVSLSYTN